VHSVSGEDFGDPVAFLYMGDTIINNAASIWNRYQGYYFRPDATGPTPETVGCRHNLKGNFLFGDGHVTSLTKAQLVGNYGTISGTRTFTTTTVDDSEGSL
jgi:prepilin-type processing-associated H-X9-DG protein